MRSNSTKNIYIVYSIILIVDNKELRIIFIVPILQYFTKIYSVFIKLLYKTVHNKLNYLFDNKMKE